MNNQNNVEIIVNDWNDIVERDNIMQMYGDSNEPFYGKNENGESITIHVSPDIIVLETMQDNGWIRKNCYYRGEWAHEEVFCDKWK